MLCSIYKSSKKEGAYLYIEKKDDFSRVPEALLETFGKPMFLMVLNLEGRELALVSKEKVIESILQQGFFLQLPPPVENVLEQYKKQNSLQSN